MIHDNNSIIDIHRHLRACILTHTQNTFLLVWFEKELEKIIERIWRTSPSDAFILHEQMLQIMGSRIQEFLPEIVNYGCAPVPYPDKEMNDSLGRIGLRLHKTGQLNLVYATITFWPWKDGCSCCTLRTICPKKILLRPKTPYFHFS